MLYEVITTRQEFGPVTVIAWWQRSYLEPIFLVTNFELAGEACYWYKKRFHNLEKSVFAV